MKHLRCQNGELKACPECKGTGRRMNHGPFGSGTGTCNFCVGKGCAPRPRPDSVDEGLIERLNEIAVFFEKENMDAEDVEDRAISAIRMTTINDAITGLSETEALRDMLNDERLLLTMIQEELGVPTEPHQTIRERLLESAAAKPKAEDGDIESNVEYISEGIKNEIIHHIDRMYPKMWEGVPKSARTSLSNTLISAVELRIRPLIKALGGGNE